MLPEIVAVVATALAALAIGAALVYILGFLVSMVVALFYKPVESIAHHTHVPSMHLPHHA